MSTRFFVLFGIFSGFLAVALGAFGAHGLKDKVSQEFLHVFEVGVRYQMYHALALIGLAWALTQYPHPLVKAAGLFFMLGTVVFSGSLYLLVFSGVRTWGAVTPVGGLLFLSGWISWAVGILKS